MMQQIATKTSDIATSSLPLDVKVEPANGTDFAVVLQQSRDTTSAFENAKNRADKMQGDTASRNENRQSQAQKSDEGAQASHDRQNKKDTSVFDSANDGKTKADLVTNKNAEDDLAVIQSNSKESDKVLAEDNAEFDYINYVSLIKALDNNGTDTSSSSAVDIEKLAALEEGGAESISEIDAANQYSNIQDTDIQEIHLDSIDESLADFALVHITQEELQAILLAQQGNREQATLSAEELKRLEDAVSKMLNQVSEQKTTSTLAANDEQLDAKLLTELLQQPVEASEEVLDALANAVSNAQKIDQNSQSETLNKEQANAKLAKEASAQIAEVASDELLTPNPQTQDDGLGLSVKDIALAGAAEHDLSAQTKNNADVQIKVNPSTSQHQNTIEKLASFDEERVNKALDNLKQRLESIVPEIKQEGKGSEFIAALQSGIKEFKEQLKQGREPGLDLKSLVAEAMQKSDIDVTPTTQAKLEPNLNQFNAMLNLASSVQAQNLHAQGLLTPSESIALEKVGQSFAQSLAQGMESASGSTKLSAQQASALDKAVNIFKPDGQQQLVEKVRWLINGRNTAAEIRLDPPELGAMQIKVNLSGDAAAVSFTVQSVQAKEALDQAVPRLRDMLQEQGIELGQSSVQQDTRGQSDEQQDQASSQGSGGSSVSDTSADDEMAASTVIEQRIAGNTIGGIDYYA